MPKNTFYKLPKDKMNRIIEVAVDEFAEYSYETASTNRIVEGADIAKGSFYQYFEDKKDLYNYIIEEIEKKRISYLTDIIENQFNSDFFKLLKQFYLAEIKFAMDSPKLSKIIQDYAKNYSIELKKEAFGHMYKCNDMFRKLILNGMDNKDINDSIDIKLNTFLLASLDISILEYFTYEANLDYEKATIYIDSIIELLKDGIKVKKRLSRNVEDRFY